VNKALYKFTDEILCAVETIIVVSNLEKAQQYPGVFCSTLLKEVNKSKLDGFLFLCDSLPYLLKLENNTHYVICSLLTVIVLLYV
jgi:hypothetical protein